MLLAKKTFPTVYVDFCTFFNISICSEKCHYAAYQFFEQNIINKVKAKRCKNCFLVIEKHVFVTSSKKSLSGILLFLIDIEPNADFVNDIHSVPVLYL